MKEIIHQLESLRRRAWLALITQRAAVVVAWIIGLLMVAIGLDYFLRLPGLFRAILEGAGLVALLYFLGTYLRAALGFHPSLTQIALRVEEALPKVHGRLASSVEFAAAGLDQSNVLAARSVRDTETRLRGEHVSRAGMRLGRTWRDVAILAVVGSVAAVCVLGNPAAAGTGLSRVLLPFGDARWPARTGVQSLMSEVLPESRVHPLGQALPLRARVTKGPYDQRVHARVRMKTEGRFGPWQDLVLTHQTGGVHERLIDTKASLVQVSFHTSDDQTDPEEVVLVPPPSVLRATLSIEPPAYAQSRTAATTLEMGPGTDERSVTETPILIGSRATLDLVLNKEIPVPRTAETLVQTFGDVSDLRPVFDTDAEGRSHWTIRWGLTGTRRLSLQLRDEYGLRNTEPITYLIEANEDRVPAVTVVEPQADEPVLASAVVPLTAEATDDVAVDWLALEAIVYRLKAADTASPATIDWQEVAEQDQATARLSADLELAALSLEEGDEVHVRGAAQDVYELDGARHEPVRSPVRRLRVISELEFASQLRRQLGAVRQNAIRIEGRQSELQEDVIDDGPQPGVERAQAQVGERIAGQRQTLDQLEELIEKNRLDDAQLADLLRQSRDLLDHAGRAANRAVEEIQRRQAEGVAPAQGRDRENQELPGLDEAPREAAEEDQPVVEAQQEVRDELADLIELLDRDEDTWVVTRQLEALLEQQSRLQNRTSRLQQQTLGRDRADLTEQELTELDRITEAQLGLRDQARQAIDDLRDRARAMQEVDPQSASGMRSAANTGEQRELDRDMENAADRAQQNQLRNATASQQNARDTLQRMLEDIEESKRAQAEQLLRQLASLIESIDRLIVVQENELAALAAAAEEGRYPGRDRAMIRLNQNTQAVASEARGMGQSARRIARALDRAADAQGAAVVGLRAEPVVAAVVQEAEDRSLELLKEARQLAEELQEQTEEDQVRQQREELIEAYREFAERQIVLREQTLKLGEHEELDRRQLVEARRLATNQDELRTGLDDLQKQTRELMDSPVFSLVHRKIDRWSRQATELLQEGDAGVSVTDRQQMIAGAIGRLIEAIEETMQPPDEFAREQEGGGGGGSGGAPPLIPPVAQLRLLQGIQEEIYIRTRDMDQRADLEDGQRRQRLRDLGQEQRELMEVGQDMLDKLQGGGAGGRPGGPGGPDAGGPEVAPGPDAFDDPDPDPEAPETNP